jgi:transposase
MGVELTEFYLTDERWALIAARLPGKEGDPGCHGRDNRLFVEAVFWVVRTGSPWRNLPAPFGKWYTNYTRFRRWTQKSVWPRVLEALKQDESCEYFLEDGAIRHAPLRALLAREARLAAMQSLPAAESERAA